MDGANPVMVVRRTTSWLRANPLLADVLLAALVLLMSVFFGLNSTTGPTEREMDALGWLLIVALNLPIIFRRRSPVLVAWATAFLTETFWVLDYPDDPTGPSLLIAVYSLGAHEDRPRSLHHFLGLIGITLAVITTGVLFSGEDLPWLAIPANMIVFATAWIVGDNFRNRRNYLVELEQKAERIEQQREAEAQRAVSDERTRIARELHDVVAHSMSVMVVQAGAARRVLETNPVEASVALQAIEKTGRESLQEMRRVLGVLRSDDTEAELAPAPGLDDFDRLIRQCEEAGLPVELTVDGDVRKLAPGLELSAYRIIQESLTNSLKHAGPARATINLDYQDDALVVAVTDDGYGAAGQSGTGQGLVGMRERVEAFGGALEAGPQRGGGYRVRATFPIAESVRA